ncbi:MAG: DUF488 domain-containing protein [Pseudonocardiaceae bacterium]
MRQTRHEVRVRRVYDRTEPDEGVRVLVDRVWPRGLRKDGANLDEWTRDVAPSTELRKWYSHDPEKFDQFRSQYRRELENPTKRAALEHLRTLLESNPLTLFTATTDVEHSNATVLAELLREEQQ